MDHKEPLIPKHGGYRKLKSYQVARASLEELRLDYEDFLRHRGLEQWDRNNPLRQNLVDRRCQTADEVASWIVGSARKSGQGGQSGLGGPEVDSRAVSSALFTNTYPELSANAALVLIAVACSLLDRQVARLAHDFETGGGFTERLYRVRSAQRRSPPGF